MEADYTTLPIGTKVGRGEIGKCPYCKKPGLIEVTNGVIFGVHSEWAKIREGLDAGVDASLEIGGEGCPMPGQVLIRIPIPKETAEPDQR
jgi:hypothetical protein